MAIVWRTDDPVTCDGCRKKFDRSELRWVGVYFCCTPCFHETWEKIAQEEWELEQDEIECDDHEWVYQPAEYETLSGRATVLQYPEMTYCEKCGKILEDE